GEISPKVYATKHAYRLSLFMAYPLAFTRKVFYPLSRTMVFATKAIDQKAREAEGSAQITADELSQALELTTHFNDKEDEKRILSGIVKFGSTEVRQVMTPRLDVVALDHSLDYDALRASIVEQGFSRVPVYEESLDNVVGVLYVKDLLPHLDEGKTF